MADYEDTVLGFDYDKADRIKRFKSSVIVLLVIALIGVGCFLCKDKIATLRLKHRLEKPTYWFDFIEYENSDEYEEYMLYFDDGILTVSCFKSVDYVEKTLYIYSYEVISPTQIRLVDGDKVTIVNVNMDYSIGYFEIDPADGFGVDCNFWCD